MRHTFFGDDVHHSVFLLYLFHPCCERMTVNKNRLVNNEKSQQMVNDSVCYVSAIVYQSIFYSFCYQMLKKDDQSTNKIRIS